MEFFWVHDGPAEILKKAGRSNGCNSDRPLKTARTGLGLSKQFLSTDCTLVRDGSVLKMRISQERGLITRHSNCTDEPWNSSVDTRPSKGPSPTTDRPGRPPGAVVETEPVQSEGSACDPGHRARAQSAADGRSAPPSESPGLKCRGPGPTGSVLCLRVSPVHWAHCQVGAVRKLAGRCSRETSVEP